MNPKTIGLAALVATLAASGLALSVGDAVDAEASWHDPDAGLVHGLVRCKVTSADPLALDCGSLPDDARIHPDTRSAKYTTLGSAGKVSARNAACACGPKLKPNQCRVKVTDAEGKTTLREAIPGEYLGPDGWEGQCVIRPCWELSEAVAEKGLGYSMPQECR